MFYNIKGLKYNFINASNVIEIYLEIYVEFINICNEPRNIYKIIFQLFNLHYIKIKKFIFYKKNNLLTK